MKYTRRWMGVFFFPAFGIFFFWPDAPARPVTARLSAAVGYSDNVFESVSDPASDGMGRIQFVWQFQTASDKPLRLVLCSHSGVEVYGRFDEEDRLIEHCTARGEWRVFRKAGVGFETRSRFQHFFEVTRGYGSHILMPFVWMNPFPKLSAQFSFLIGDFDYRAGSNFDTRMMGFLFSMDWQIASRLSLAAQWNQTGVDYDRFALASLSAPPYWTYSAARQEDRNEEVSLELEWYYEALFRVGFAWEKNRSNSYGFGYDCPKWTVLIARQLPDDWTFSLFFRLQRKHYEDRLAPAFQIYPDTESEENNSFFVELERDLSSRSSLEFKGGWVRNESPFRSRYYKKSFFSVGIARQF